MCVFQAFKRTYLLFKRLSIVINKNIPNQLNCFLLTIMGKDVRTAAMWVSRPETLIADVRNSSFLIHCEKNHVFMNPFSLIVMAEELLRADICVSSPETLISAVQLTSL